MSIGYLPWNQPVTMADRVCLRDGDAELSYGEVARRAEAVAERFATLGVRRGDVVAIMLPNCAELLLGLLAAWRLGAAVTPVNPALTAQEARYQIEDAGAVLLRTSTADADYGPYRIGLAKAARPVRRRCARARDRIGALALLIYTSGTTGRPKGVMLDHANQRRGGIIGWPGCARPPLPAGAAAVPRERDHGQRRVPPAVRRRLDVHRRAVPGGQLLAAVERDRPTFFSAVPTIYALLVSRPGAPPGHPEPALCHLRGRARAAPADRRVRGAVRRPRGGGLRAVGVHGGLHAESAARRPQGGQRRAAAARHRCRGVDAADQLLPAGQAGEVVVRGPNVMRGYLGRPEETAEVLARRLAAHRRRRPVRRRRLPHPGRPGQGPDHPGRGEHLPQRDRGRAPLPPGGARGRGRRAAGSGLRRAAGRLRRPFVPAHRGTEGHRWSTAGSSWPGQGPGAVYIEALPKNAVGKIAKPACGNH